MLGCGWPRSQPPMVVYLENRISAAARAAIFMLRGGRRSDIKPFTMAYSDGSSIKNNSGIIFAL